MDWGFEPVFWAFLQVPDNNRQREPQLTANPTSIKGFQHSLYSELGGLTMFSGQLGRSIIFPIMIFSIYGSGFIGNGIYY